MLTVQAEIKLSKNLLAAAQSFAWLVITTGALVLIGWSADISFLKSVFPGLVAMNPATAAAFILSGFGVLFLKSEERTGPIKTCGAVLAAAAAFIGASRIAAYLTPLDFKIDQFLFRHQLGTNVMAPNTAWNFLLVGICLLIMDVKSRAALWIQQALITIALLTSFLAAVGYVYSVRAFYNISTYIPMALNTSITFSFLVIAIFCLRPRRGLMTVFTSAYAGGEIARRLLPTTFAIPAFLGGLKLMGEKYGYYDSSFGAALMAVGNMMIFTAIVWWTARLLNRTDKARSDAEEDLRAMKDELEIRVEKRTQELEETQRQLARQERLRALGEMASGIAHDFNNALSPILGYSELMLDGDSEDDRGKRVEYLKAMNMAAKDAATIVGRLRLFGRAHDNDLPLVPVDLNRLVEEAITLTKPKWKTQAMAKEISVTVGRDLKPVPFIQANEQQIREVLTNLIFNAVDALTKNGSIVIRTSSQGGEVVLEVSDTGMGMTEEIRQRCLEPFFSTKGDRGTGLGLAMVHGIIRRHKGMMDIQSEVGKGTTFIIRFPVSREQPSAAAGSAEKNRQRVLKILYAEDEPAVQGVIKGYLLRDGHQVDTANNGAEALDKFYLNKNYYDLVISDRTMPQMGGEPLAAAVRNLVPSQKFILLSGTSDPGRNYHTAHIDMVLNKPITLEALRQALSKLFPS